jgi:hypothetical protein
MVIDRRADGSIIYHSVSRGVLNLDSEEELQEAIAEEQSLTNLQPQRRKYVARTAEEIHQKSMGQS